MFLFLGVAGNAQSVMGTKANWWCPLLAFLLGILFVTIIGGATSSLMVLPICHNICCGRSSFIVDWNVTLTALFCKQNKVFCFKDSLGQFVHAHSRCFPFDASMAESEAANAILHVALQIAIERGFDQVAFQSGCQRVASDILNGCNWANELGMSILVVNLFSHQILASI